MKHRVAGALVVLLAFLPSCALLRQLPKGSVKPVRATGPVAIRTDLWGRMNDERSARGLPPLAWNGRLADYAAAWSKKMGTGKGMVHSDIRKLLVKNNYAGENIATGSRGTTASGLHAGWMRSPIHRDDMLSPGFQQAGIGIYCAANGTVWATVDFGRPWASGQPPTYNGGTAANPFARSDSDSTHC